MIGTTLMLAIRQLARSPGRTALTSLGLLIGVAAVIAMVSIGQSATARVEADLASLGGDLLFVVPGGEHGAGRSAPPLTMADAAAIEDQVPGLSHVSPIAQGGALLTRGDASHRTSITGADNAYLDITQWVVGHGRRFEEAELAGGASVCLIGETVREELFGSAEALGGEVRMAKLSCEVIGVLSPKGENTFGIDQDDLVVVPLRTYQRRVAGDSDIDMIFLSPEPDAPAGETKAQLDQLMSERRHVREGMDPDFTIRDTKELEQMISGVSGVLTGFLAAVAAVSLVVGGIGIMNIMLVSVTERTREIGIRMAVGALARDVLVQFLVEAMVLALVGGVAGIAVGLLVSWAAATWLEAPLVIDPLVIAAAFGFSALIGVVFGYYPARRAARMKPIDALRHE